ncbi:MAG: hypothetical protein M0R48_09960 [Candidatus Omnitrophica bacterium]|jgi:hypothetical protein|nr:hypothetical protein [Candidatus Omnitrophota bacterium]
MDRKVYDDGNSFDIKNMADIKNVVKKLGILSGGVLSVAFIVILVFRLLWVTGVEKHEFAYTFDRLDGSISEITNSGWIIRTPIRYKVYTVDCRPIQITISANQRVLNAKLVRFNPRGLKEFIEWHGAGAGSGINSPLNEILKCYAFDTVNGADCPFLEVLQDISPNQGMIKTNEGK